MSKSGQTPKEAIPEQTLRRIPFYHQILIEMESKQKRYVSSRYLATFFKVDDTQVRKDVSVLGYKGKPKSGYSVTGLKQAIGEFLGINYENTAVLIGAGRLGSALTNYPGLSEYGLKLIAVFDNDPNKIGRFLDGHKILSPDSLVRVVKRRNVGIAIIAVPRDAAQHVCDRVISLGIQAVWNFAPIQLTVPSSVILRNENLAVGLAILSHYLKKKQASV
jgi:redox-sensing transcriptional repressor